MRHRGELSEFEHSVAARVGSIYRARGRSIGAKVLRSASLEVGRGGSPDSRETDDQRERAVRATDRFSELVGLLRPHGAAGSAIVALVTEDRPVAPAALPKVRRVLREMAGPLGIAKSFSAAIGT